MRAAPPSLTSSVSDPSGRNNTTTAPIRLSAATAMSMLGRVSISTPTDSPWRTPTDSSPATTASIRAFRAACVWARSSHKNPTAPGWPSARSSSRQPRDTRDSGRTNSRRNSRGRLVAAPAVSAHVASMVAAPKRQPACIPWPTAEISGLRRPRPAAAFGDAVASGPTISGISVPLSRCDAQAATVGQVPFVAAEPTTMPRCPTGSETSWMSARGAARPMALTASGCPILSFSPTKHRMGRSMSASASGRPSMTMPPASIRFCAMNWRSASASAGAGQAIQPSDSMKRR